MSENFENRIQNVKNRIQDDVDHHQTRSIDAPPSDKNSVLDGNGSGHDDMPTKKKKTRRGKPKRRYAANPYTKLSLQQRKFQTDVQKRKGNKKRSKILAPGQALAPYNSNQFLIEDHDHGYLKEIEDRLENRIERLKTRSGQSRTRDSSFSVDSDMDYYSSPEDEEEFLTREFSNTYQDIRSERLNSMSREELLQECIQMENRVEMLTKCLSSKSPSVGCESKDITQKDNGIMVDISSMPDFQLEIMKLMNENDALRRENERLRKTRQPRTRGSVSSSVSSSVDSESDSSSGSSSDSDSSLEPEKMGSKSPVENTPYSSMNGFASHQSSGPSTPAPENDNPDSNRTVSESDVDETSEAK